MFYLVAPKGVVRAQELPAGVGLLEPIGSGDGRRLVTRVKAVRQEPDPMTLVRVMAHVLMWRKDQRPDGTAGRAHRAAFWRAFVAEQKDFAAIGRSVKGRMRQMLTDALAARRAAEAKAEQLVCAQQVLDELGVKLGERWETQFRIRREVQQALNGGAPAVVADLTATIDRLATLKRHLENAVGVEG